MGIGTRVQYSEVSLAAGNVISDGKTGECRNLCPEAYNASQNPAITRKETSVFALKVSPPRSNLELPKSNICVDIIVAHEVKTPHNFGEKPFLGFKAVTMTPLCRKLIEPSLLTPAETKWINDYHTEIWDKTSSYFDSDELTKNWLKRETQVL